MDCARHRDAQGLAGPSRQVVKSGNQVTGQIAEANERGGTLQDISRFHNDAFRLPVAISHFLHEMKSRQTAIELESRLHERMSFRLRPGSRVCWQNKKLAFGDKSRQGMQELY